MHIDLIDFGCGLIIILQIINLWVLCEMKKELRAIKINVCGQLCWLTQKIHGISDTIVYIESCVR